MDDKTHKLSNTNFYKDNNFNKVKKQISDNTTDNISFIEREMSFSIFFILSFQKRRPRSLPELSSNDNTVFFFSAVFADSSFFENSDWLCTAAF